MDDRKEAECLDDTSPDEMEEGVYDINDDNNGKKWRGKRVRMPIWHFPWWDGVRCKWYKWWQE